MAFDRENKIVKLCADGISLEGSGQIEKALQQFCDAWDRASTDHEKSIAARFLARAQPKISSRLTWNKIALCFARKVNDEYSRSTYALHYLNIAKCYEDLGNVVVALNYYLLARSNECHVITTDYGKRVKAEIKEGIKRVVQSI